MTVQEMQNILNENGFGHVNVINEDTVWTIVDSEEEIFKREDEYGGHPMSGLASYGMVSGDHRMIRAIYDDMQTVFELIKKEVSNG